MASRSHGCGFCEGFAAGQAEEHWTATDAQGRVLYVGYAYSSDPGLHFVDAEDERWRSVLEPVCQQGPHWGLHCDDEGMHVFTVAAGELDARDWRQVRGVLHTAASGLDNRSYPEEGVSDYSAPAVRYEQRKGYEHHFSAKTRWDALGAQLLVLEAWVTSKPS